MRSQGMKSRKEHGREQKKNMERIRSEKLREHQHREGYARYLERTGVEWDGNNNVEHMWERVKRAMVESAREVCALVKVEGKDQNSYYYLGSISQKAALQMHIVAEHKAVLKIRNLKNKNCRRAKSSRIEKTDPHREPLTSRKGKTDYRAQNK